jgi:glucosamine--fructose-6-phosphate aminotransferase (isomerizing)
MTDPSLLAQDIAEQPPLLASLPDLREATTLLERSSVVRLVGIGSSRHVAAYGGVCLDGARVATVLPAPGAGVPQPLLSARDLLVVVSQSGATPALLDLASDARACGALVLALTNCPDSPLEQLAHVVLPCAAGSEQVVPATKSVTRSMLLLRALAGPVDVQSLASATLRQVNTEVAVAGSPPAFVVAGGFAAQAVADEVALKLAEVAGLAVAPESLVDFLHGPSAVSAPVLALVDSDDPNRAALPSGTQHLPFATTGDRTLDRIVQVVAGQCAALAWARALAVDPDDPKGLAKVTLTR